MAIDRSNPNDKYGSVQSQNQVIAIVVDDRDPDESGRFKCRILGDQDDEGLVPDDKLAWYACTGSGTAGMRGHGGFPPPYTVGSRVILPNMDQQGYYIGASAPNTLTDKNYEDRHTEGTSTTREDHFPKGPGDVMTNTLFDGSKHLFELERTTKQALALANQKTTSKRKTTDNQKKGIGSDPTKPSYLDQEPVQWLSDNLNPQTIGTLKESAASMSNPQQFIQSTLGAQMGVLIPNSLDIIEKLKETAASGTNKTAIQSIGGIGNFTGAISGIMSFMKKKAKNKNVDDETINALYELYFEETGLEALDENGEETVLYQAWEILYFARGIAAEIETS